MSSQKIDPIINMLVAGIVINTVANINSFRPGGYLIPSIDYLQVVRATGVVAKNMLEK